MKCSDCHAPIRPIIAVDIDGTLGQWHQSFLSFAEKWLGHPPRWFPRHWDGCGNLNEMMGVDLEVYRQMKLAFRQGGFKRWMNPYPGAASLMWAIHEMNVEIWITTTRPWQRLDNIDPDTKEWLRRHRVRYDHLLFDEDKYGLLTNLVNPERIIMVMDDEEEQMHRAEELRLPFVLRRTEYNSSYQSEHMVHDLTEAVRIAIERRGLYESLGH